MSQWTLFWTSSSQGSLVFRANPTFLETSTIELKMDMRGIPWCTGIIYKRGKTVWKMQMRSGCYPQSLREKNPNTGRKYTKTSRLMCETTVPLHGTGKIDSMDSVFCVIVVILHLHEHGVCGQLIIKKQTYWPKGWPRAKIESYMEGNPLGLVRNLSQDMGEHLSTWTAPEMTGLLPNWWSPTYYSTKCPIIPPTGKKYG